MTFSQRLVDRLPAEVLGAVRRNHTPLMPFDIIICLFLCLLLPASHGAPPQYCEHC